MAEKKSDLNKTERVYLTFTSKQIQMIDDLVNSGVYGSKRAEVVKQVFLNSLYKGKNNY